MANGSNAPCPRMAKRCRRCPTEAYEEARAAAPGYDIHGLESEWREWWASSGKPKLDNPAAAFVGFCRSRHKRAPIQRETDRNWERPLPYRTNRQIAAQGCYTANPICWAKMASSEIERLSRSIFGGIASILVPMTKAMPCPPSFFR